MTSVQSALKIVAYEVTGSKHPMSSPLTPIKIELTWERKYDNGLYPKIPKEWNQMWAIRLREFVFDKGGNWVYEPRPSGRTWGFIKGSRWSTAQEAHAFLVHHAGGGK